MRLHSHAGGRVKVEGPLRPMPSATGSAPTRSVSLNRTQPRAPAWTAKGPLPRHRRQPGRPYAPATAAAAAAQQPEPEPEPARPPPGLASTDGEGDAASTSSSESDTEGGAARSLQRRLLQLPLEVGAVLSNDNGRYLAKRSRSRWWSGGATGLRVPGDSLGDVHRHPPPLSVWQKVAPLGLIFFAASFNLTILQNLKDAIMVTTAGAETLPFLASLVVLPASLGFFMLYGRMVERLPSQAVFYAAVAPLVAFYVFFTTVLYPAAGALHPHGLYEALAPALPLGLHGLLKVVEHWTFSLFFCAAELWGSVVISVLFWSLANEVCTVSEAKTVYPLMGIAANVALVLSGSFVKYVNGSLATSTQASLSFLVAAVVGMTGVMAAAKWAIDTWVISPYCSIDAKPVAEQAPKGKGVKKKKKGSLGESFSVIRSSPKIMNLAMLVVSYGVSHRLFEFAWKGQLRVLYPTPQAYQSVLADVSIATGWATIAFMLLGKFVFQKLGWSAAAAATPLAMGITGCGFFFLSLAANQGVSVAGMDPAAMAFAGVAAGAVTQVFARSAKFSLFDPAKEMVYIEMSKEEKSKGKAAVDLLGSQIGKSGGAWITQALLLLLGSIASAMPVISAAFLAVVISWLSAVRSLGVQLKEYEEQKAAAAASKAAAANGAAPANGAGMNGHANGSAAKGSDEGPSAAPLRLTPTQA